jgi:hypothetical protein
MYLDGECHNELRMYQYTIMRNGQGVAQNTRTDAAEVQTTDVRHILLLIYICSVEF